MSSSFSSALNEAENEIQESLKRSASAIAGCDQEIELLRKRRKKLQQENHQLKLKASLKTKGSSAWYKLAEGEKWKKGSVLAVFASGKLPNEMKEEVWAVNAPECIRDDRDILLARLERDDFAEYYITNETIFRIPKEFLCDKEIVCRAIEHYPEVLVNDPISADLLNDEEVFRAFLKSMSMTERDGFRRAAIGKFSPAIRGNKELMLEAAKHTWAVLDEFSGELGSDRSFALEVAPSAASDIPDDSLLRFSEILRGDREVVRAFVYANGNCLKGASSSLRGDFGIVSIACHFAPESLIYCLDGSTKKRLIEDKAFMLDIFRRVEKGTPELWEMLAPSLKLDHEITFAALVSNCLKFDGLPVELRCNRQFWMESIEKKASFWLHIPDQFADDCNLARKIRTFDDDQLLSKVFKRFPSLASDRGFWNTIITSNSSKNAIRDYASAAILTDKELMVKACSCDTNVLSLIGPLSQDRDIIEAMVRDHPIRLRKVPSETQLLFPDLVARAIRRVDKSQLSSLGRGIAKNLRTNREVALAWFSRGGSFFRERFGSNFRNDKEVFLLIAEHNGRDFQHASPVLRNDKQFMLQAVEKNSSVFYDANSRLQLDLDLALVAFASSSEFVEDYLSEGSRERIDLAESVLMMCRRKLELHDIFVKEILCGMSIRPGPDCYLSLLDQGQETSLAYKMLLAEYLDIPMGKELRLLRHASEHIPDDCEDYYISSEDSEESSDDINYYGYDDFDDYDESPYGQDLFAIRRRWFDIGG